MTSTNNAISADTVVNANLTAGDLRSIYGVLAHMKNDFGTPWVEDVMKQIADSGVYDNIEYQKEMADKMSFRDSAMW